MSSLLEQIVIGARSNDPMNWFEILIFIFIMVVSVIIRATKTKKGILDKKEKIPQRPRPSGPRPPQQRVRMPRKAAAAPQPATQKRPPKPRMPAKRPPEKQPVSPEFAESSIIEQKVPDLSVKAISEPSVKPAISVVSEKAPVAIYSDEILLDYSKSDDLRKAILHYEILGKPLSLRRTEEGSF